MRILITGVTGFIGSRLTETLASNNHEVWGLSRNPNKAKQRVPQLTEVFAWDPVADQPTADAFTDVNAVVHLAGEAVSGRWTKKKKQRIQDSRVIGTRNLVKALEQTGETTVLVSSSAIGYYGDHGNSELTEDHPSGRDFLSETCRSWEAEANNAITHGVRVVVIRTGIVLADGGGALANMLLPFKMGVGGPMGSGKQWWSWIHRDDLVAICLRAISDNEMAGVYNGTAPHPMQQRDFSTVLGKVLHRPAFLPTPAFALKLALGGFSTELLGSKKIIPKRLQEAGFEFQSPELDTALRQALGR